MNTSYAKAQSAVATLKAAVFEKLQDNPNGLTNAQLGRSLGIYSGHVGHEGHISRTLLAFMESEEVVAQDPETKIWKICNQ